MIRRLGQKKLTAGPQLLEVARRAFWTCSSASAGSFAASPWRPKAAFGLVAQLVRASCL